MFKQKLSDSNIKNILDNFELGDVEAVEPLSASGNMAYVIKAGRGEYFLRLSPLGPRYRSKKEISAELELIHRLIENNFPTPAPVPMRNGNEIISWGEHFGYLRGFCAGEYKPDPSEEEIKKFGEILGWFHVLVADFRTKEKREHIWDPEQTKKNFLEGDTELILKSDFPWKGEFIKKFSKGMSSLKFPEDVPLGTIHEDLGKRHVLWVGDKITGIIDFDRCYFGKLVLDLGQACRGWCFEDWKIWSNKKFEALLSGYEKRRKLTQAEKKCMVDAIKFGILERGLSFCLRFGATNDMEDAKYAMTSVSANGLLGEVEKNRSEIEKILKEKTA